MRSFGICGASSLLLAGARAFHAVPGNSRLSLAAAPQAFLALRQSRGLSPAGSLPYVSRQRGGQRRLRMDASSDKKEEAGPTGHQAPSGPQKVLSPEEEALMERIKTHQDSAARLSRAQEVRNLVEYSIGFGVISTNSRTLEGYPSGSVIGFGLDESGRPLFAVSSMSAHTGDLMADSRMGLCVTAAGFKGASDGRVSMIGETNKVPEDERQKVREMYKKKHPKAFWIDFGDFSLLRMDTIKAIRFVGGFARAGDVDPEEYLNTKPDPVAEFSAPILTHMNDDHSSATKAMVEHYITGGVEVKSAMISAVDSLGMDVVVGMMDGQSGKLRLPFPRPAVDRKDVKTLIVEMTNASATPAPAAEA